MSIIVQRQRSCWGSNWGGRVQNFRWLHLAFLFFLPSFFLACLYFCVGVLALVNWRETTALVLPGFISLLFPGSLHGTYYFSRIFVFFLHWYLSFLVASILKLKGDLGSILPEIVFLRGIDDEERGCVMVANLVRSSCMQIRHKCSCEWVKLPAWSSFGWHHWQAPTQSHRLALCVCRSVVPANHC